MYEPRQCDLTFLKSTYRDFVRNMAALVLILGYMEFLFQYLGLRVEFCWQIGLRSCRAWKRLVVQSSLSSLDLHGVGESVCL